MVLSILCFREGKKNLPKISSFDSALGRRRHALKGRGGDVGDNSARYLTGKWNVLVGNKYQEKKSTFM